MVTREILLARLPVALNLPFDLLQIPLSDPENQPSGVANTSGSDYCPELAEVVGLVL
jgi:hypothetical protein